LFFRIQLNFHSILEALSRHIHLPLHPAPSHPHFLTYPSSPTCIPFLTSIPTYLISLTYWASLPTSYRSPVPFYYNVHNFFITIPFLFLFFLTPLFNVGPGKEKVSPNLKCNDLGLDSGITF
jgi:hypothetical protein